MRIIDRVILAPVAETKDTGGKTKTAGATAARTYSDRSFSNRFQRAQAAARAF